MPIRCLLAVPSPQTLSRITRPYVAGPMAVRARRADLQRIFNVASGFLIVAPRQ